MRVVCATLIWLAGCRNSEPAPPVEVPIAQSPGDASTPDAMPRLAPERETFWNQIIGDQPGQPGPEVLAWCQKPHSAGEERVFGPDLALTQQDDYCSLTAWGLSEDPSGAMVAELDTVLARWGAPDPGSADMWIDRHDRLTATVSRRTSGARATSTGERPVQINVHWHPHVELESIIGAPNRLLRELDVEALVRAPPEPLRRVVRAPFRLTASCTASGPSPPGGSETRIFSCAMRGRHVVAVTIFVPPDAIPHVMELLTQSLGPVDIVATKAEIDAGMANATDKVHRHAGIRYLVSIDRRGVDIDVQRDR